ncbi:hypothetical protein AVEN_168960-1 [Araneus ventricosus]|uniref:Mos1 transposase HTH domain-containing protein n=1 Tax=Araneus ventricosus TaxID=182803 RepID=A0A4Y1ZT15_ARAVE|nr:hypothetical protein AVEN_234720-1 [Araneus ventricosus]GBL65754.1 hypothetical protein AVEN_14477-1 [Araneus ventricosus]GBL65787.1 hypothetical protein AVEN_53807-1 [Araneus ventricosus]GBL65823.1 hypothetical protein AVEN_168960-1 [Araneus ventricosus]
MFKIIESPAPCEVRSVIRFLSARNLSAADIHRHICEVYEGTAMCEGKVRKMMASMFWDRHGILLADFMQLENHHKCGSLLPNPAKATQSNSKQNTRHADRGNFVTP